jgi:hypothetical protein
MSRSACLASLIVIVCGVALAGCAVERDALVASIDDPLPPVESVEIGQRGEYIVNGKLFIPLAVWLIDPEHFPKLKASGINTCAGYWWGEEQKKGSGDTQSMDQYAEMVRKAGFYHIPPYMAKQLDATRRVAAMNHVLAWTQNDEPDLPQKVTDPKTGKVTWQPRDTLDETAEMYRQIRALDAMRPVQIGFTSHFMSDQNNKYDAAMKKRIYPAYAQYGDAIGYDTYPIFGYNRPDHLYRVAMGVTELRALAGPGKAIACAIETNKGSKWVSQKNQLDVLPKHTRAETWMALIRGATEILYFTHSWVPEPYTQYAPSPKMIAELKRLNGQITRLTAPLLSRPAEVNIGMKLFAVIGDVPLGCHFKATQYKGDTYIFAQNMDMNPGKDDRGRATSTPRTGNAVFTVQGLKAGTQIEVIDEDRTVTSGDGVFIDKFGGLAEHIYRFRL